jgi:pimeloyl-ACP methyl ester carboxylesterase
MDAELMQWKTSGHFFDYLGFNVFYRIEGTGPVLLLIHGYPFNSWDWAPIWSTLVSRFTVIAPDMLGMGFSDKPFAYGYSVHGHADMHEALLAELGVARCHILAHDIGDSVAQELLVRHDGRQQSSGPVEIESITWLNGGMFNEV